MAPAEVKYYLAMGRKKSYNAECLLSLSQRSSSSTSAQSLWQFWIKSSFPASSPDKPRMSTLQKNNTTSGQGSTLLGPGVADVELPADVEVSFHPYGAASSISPAPVVLAAREAQHGVRLHEGVVTLQTDAGKVQGPQGDHREVPVEVDRAAEAKALLQEERDASGEFLWSKRANVWTRDLKRGWCLGWKVLLWWESCRSYANHVSVRVIFCSK